jgi:membrane protein DedA with SNARE-associated domain
VDETLREIAASLGEQPDAVKLWALAASAFLIEDVTCVAAGVLVGAGQLHLGVAAAGCWLGVVLGDGLLWGLGWLLGPRALRLPGIRRVVHDSTIDWARDVFDRRGLWLVLAARCLPGTRLPAYLAAGALRLGGLRFPALASLAALLWSAALIGLALGVGPTIASALAAAGAHPALRALGAVLAVVLLLRWGARRAAARAMLKDDVPDR